MPLPLFFFFFVLCCVGQKNVCPLWHHAARKGCNHFVELHMYSIWYYHSILLGVVG